MKILIDMNLSPAWTGVFEATGWDAVHWSDVGDPSAADREVMAWARDRGYIVFTHDLDFGTLLALTRAGQPSVVQVRTQDVTPSHLGAILTGVLREHEQLLTAGAIVTIDEAAARVRILPLSEK
jgi:predicted nuclease of predicted toxin-antitoxin system